MENGKNQVHFLTYIFQYMHRCITKTPNFSLFHLGSVPYSLGIHLWHSMCTSLSWKLLKCVLCAPSGILRCFCHFWLDKFATFFGKIGTSGLIWNMDQMKAWEKVGLQSGLIKALKPSLNSENSVYIQELEFLKKEILHMYLEFCSKESRKI